MIDNTEVVYEVEEKKKILQNIVDENIERKVHVKAGSVKIYARCV